MKIREEMMEYIDELNELIGSVRGKESSFTDKASEVMTKLELKLDTLIIQLEEAKNDRY